MWLCYFVLAFVAVQAGQGPQDLNRQGDQPVKIKITGEGTIASNGKTSLNINVQIGGNPASLGLIRPGKGGRPGRFPGAGPRKGGRFPGKFGRRPGGFPGAGGAQPTPTPSAGAPTSGTPGRGSPTSVPPTSGPQTSGLPTSGTPASGAPTSGTPTSGTPTSGTTPATGGGTPGEFTTEEEIGLATHNEFRQIHLVPPMTLDRTMCDEAKKYAETLAQKGGLEHSSKEERDGQGENLSYGCSSTSAQTIEEAVTNWYNEVCDPGYDFNNGGFSGGTGHFTQVVWKESTVLGIGRAESKKNGMKCAYIVGRYKPAGNMMGSFPTNVLKGNFKKSYCDTIKSNKRKFYDENGKAIAIGTPLTAVDLPHARPQGPGHIIELLNSKKKKTFVGQNHH